MAFSFFPQLNLVPGVERTIAVFDPFQPLQAVGPRARERVERAPGQKIKPFLNISNR
jgi:hypothetical protein